VDDEAHILARLDRIGALDRSGAPTETLLAELRGLLRDAGAPTREAGASGKEVVERLRTAPLGT
jgi:hypothetical protein